MASLKGLYIDIYILALFSDGLQVACVQEPFPPTPSHHLSGHGEDISFSINAVV